MNITSSQKGREMTEASSILTSLLRRLGAGRRVRFDASAGTGAPIAMSFRGEGEREDADVPPRSRPLSDDPKPSPNRPGRNPRRLNAAATGLGAVLVLLTFTPAALAGTGHAYSTSFGSAGTAAGQFTEPQGVAVNDETGDVYVVDKGNDRVEYFSAAGTPEGEFNGSGLNLNEGVGKPATGRFENPTWIAVDNDKSSPSYGDVYVTDNGHKVVDKFSMTGAYIGQITTGAGGQPFSGLYGVAVDTEGKLWVYHSPNSIDDYSDAVANEFIADFSSTGEGHPGFAVGPKDNLYVDYGYFYEFNGTEPVWEREAATAATITLSGEAYVDNVTTVGAFSPTPTSPPAFTLNQRFGQGHLTHGAGIAVNTASGAVYVADSAGDDVAIFVQGATPEEPKTEAAGELGSTTATLHGQLNPKGAKGALEYQFDYNKGSSCTGGQSFPVPPGKVTEADKAKVEAKVTGLQPSAQYTFCLVAINGYGETLGNEVSLTTKGAAPEVVSESAVGPEETKTTLAAQINPNNQETTYTFEYSTSEAEVLAGNGTKIAGESAIPPEEFGPQSVSVSTGEVLTGQTVYYYRVLAENVKGEKATPGKVEHFTTGPPEEPETLEPEAVTTTTAVLRGVLNPHKPGDTGTYQFFYREGSECRFGNSHLTEPAGNAAGAQSEHVSTEVTGLLPNATYTVCVLVHNEAGEHGLGGPVSFTTRAVTPALAAEEVTDLTTGSAVLDATVDPEGSAVLTCTFEYGTSSSYEHSVPCEHPNAVGLGTGRAPVAVSDKIEGISTSTTEYHWRISVTNGAGESVSRDHTFVYPTTGEELPDGRAYEMVTPPQKNGALIGGAFGGVADQESADGTRVMAASIQCLGTSEGCTADRRTQGEPYEFVRTSTGWVTRPLAPPATELADNGTKLFNADTDTALFEAPNPQHGGRNDFYARSTEGLFSDVGPVAPGSAARPEEVHSVAATGDLSHIIYESYAGQFRWPGDPTESNSRTVYEYEGTGNSQPRLVGLSGGPGSPLESECGTSLGASTGELGGTQYGAISEDGETVYFTAQGRDGNKQCEEYPGGATAPPASRLYARYEHARTQPISVPAPAGETCDAACLAQPAAEPRFEGASSDGSRVFFTDTQQLTDSASEDSHKGDESALGLCGKTAAGFSGCNLYESICPDRCLDAGARELIDVSAGDTSGGGPRVQGVMAMANDGSHVYFVARGKLATNKSALGEEAVAGEDNLYMYERDASAPNGRLAFVATLANVDYREWNDNESHVNVTPDGRFLVFTSHRALTPDDTREEGPAQVYRYDAQTDELIRISIGERGFNDNGTNGILGGTAINGGSSGDARIVPTYDSTDSGMVGIRRQDPTMSDNGEYVFFQSPVALTPHALNDIPVALTEPKPGEHATEYAQNVYEYHDGHVYLLSDGRDGATATHICQTSSTTCLLGSDASGHNVFFLTADSLVPADTDTQVDIYDARICEPSSPCIQPASAPLPPCNEEACHGTPAATPSLLTPGSASFNGQGNIAGGRAPNPVKPKSLTRTQKLANALKSCKKDKKKARRKSCEASAHKKYGAAKKSNKKKGSRS